MKLKNNFDNIQGRSKSIRIYSNIKFLFFLSFPINAPVTSDYIKKQIVNIINNKQQQPSQPQLTSSPNLLQQQQQQTQPQQQQQQHIINQPIQQQQQHNLLINNQNDYAIRSKYRIYNKLLLIN
jgi:hypothetical protein